MLGDPNDACYRRKHFSFGHEPTHEIFVLQQQHNEYLERMCVCLFLAIRTDYMFSCSQSLKCVLSALQPGSIGLDSCGKLPWSETTFEIGLAIATSFPTKFITDY